MRKAKYKFNPETLEYQKVKPQLGKVLLKGFGVFSLALILGFVMSQFLLEFTDTPDEKRLKSELDHYKVQYSLLSNKLENANKTMATLQQRDEEIYREIFDADPISAEVREAGFGGVDKYNGLEDGQIKDLHKELDKLNSQAKIQSQSFDELIALALRRTDKLSSIPAIQPVANKDLKRLASGYGYRIDPIYRTRKFHKGIDFSSPTGSDVYATGDGVVKKIESRRWGYGKHIIIDHGHGYETLYGHLSEFKVKVGQKVKRGQIIALVGNTGKSTAPHLHYEVHQNGNAVNPSGYFYNDLTDEQYEELLQRAANSTVSFD